MSEHQQNIIHLFFYFKKVRVIVFGYHINTHRYYKPIYNKLFITYLLEIE